MRRLPASSLLALAWLGCGPGSAPLDVGEAGVGLPSCAAPLVVAGRTGLVSLMLDTRGGPPGLVPLPCTSAAASLAPQVVVAYDVPGSGPQAIELSTANAGTDGNFDTLVAVRGDRCMPERTDEDPLYCFDDETGTREFRGHGSFVAEGGERVYIVVTGWGGMYQGRADEGLVQLDIDAQPVTPPTIDEASALVTPDSIRIDVRGGDAGRDASGVVLTFHGPAGELVDVNGDGLFDAGDVVTGDFDRPVVGATTFAETATLASTGTGGAATIGVRIIDRAGVLSDRTIATPARVGRVVGIGEGCDATNVCGPELACDGTSMCAPAPDRALACAAPTVLELTAPTDGRATTATRQSVLTAGPGLFSAPVLCEDSGTPHEATGGREDLYALHVPAGRFDLILTTDSPGTAGASPREPDTILYVRRSCGDALSAIATECNDDIETDVNLRSRVVLSDLSDVTLTAFVEIFNGAPDDGDGLRYEIAATLRPVLDTGASCDPAGIENRCTLGECPVATRMCP